MSAFLFYPLAALALASALGVVLAANPVRAALSLVCTLFLLAVFYVTLDAHLVAALQIIVYAGAVMVLFLFVITLLNLQADPKEDGLPVVSWMAAAGGGMMALILGAAMYGLPSGEITAAPEGYGTTAVLARRLFREDVLAFEVTSILLLVAVVGAVVLAKRDDPAEVKSGTVE